MGKFTLAISLIVFLAASSSRAEKCKDVVSQELSRFGFGTFDNPTINKTTGVTPAGDHHFIKFSNSDGFQIIANLSQDQKSIVSYFVRGAVEKDRGVSSGFQDHRVLDVDCNVTSIENGWRFEKGEKVEVKDDFKVTADFCTQFYPAALNKNPNLLCDKDAFGKFVASTNSSFAKTDNKTVMNAFAACRDYKFAKKSSKASVGTSDPTVGTR